MRHMIRPPPPRFNLLAASLQQRNEPRVLTLNVLSKSSRAVLERVGYLGSRMPAEFTMIWTGELKADSAASKRDVTWSGLETSAFKVMALGGIGVSVSIRAALPLLLLIWAATRSAWDESEV